MHEDCKNKFKQKELPDIKYFHSSLNNIKRSFDDYNYAKEIYNYFGCEEISDYNDLYIKTDVLLLADVLTAYRKQMHQIYSLDPLYCISTPGFSNRAMLKMTSIKIKLLADLNMHLIIENGIRGGRCKPIYYHAKANNKNINPNFNNKKESYIISPDANSLYASAMCYEIQYGKIKFNYNISKYTDEYVLDLNPYGEYLFVFVGDIH